ncbi:hypothetical protein NNJEOMEG_00300 [Fundidesulfovibrio magnetotacticus]|uniref:Uncharacterized protein n=1 Tax=Fundidesulfovibrio magnetotacticus TaxID=2730080 RepID=A0A6V8LW32_9BACT|nr:hypothetical protein [Fundidesulfovibrio magnetotacticus]GFK92475.1 hypothetical protein NNJEOMEG_00300 [Fundidesulfovibrio magnetotacticus]
MRLFKIVVLVAVLAAVSVGSAIAKAPASYAGTYGFKSEAAKGSLKLTRVKGAQHAYEVLMVAKDGATCSMEGFITIEDGVGISTDDPKCRFSLTFEKGNARLDSGKACNQCGGKASIDGVYKKGMK